MTAEQPNPIEQIAGVLMAQNLAFATLVGLLEESGQLRVGQMQLALEQLLNRRKQPEALAHPFELKVLEALAESLRKPLPVNSERSD